MTQQLSLFDRIVNRERSQATAKHHSSSEQQTIPFRSQVESDALENYQLVRSRRKTLSVSVKNAVVKVRAPLKAPRYWIEQMVEERRDWIERQLKTQQQNMREVFRVVDNAKFSLLETNNYRIRLCSTDKNAAKSNRSRKSAKLSENQGLILIELPSNQTGDATNLNNSENLATQAFAKWLKQKAEELLTPRVYKFNEQLALKPSSRTASLSKVKFRATKSKWGHCTSEGVIQLNPCLVMAPQPVCDYVIIHELCHLRHRNHSKQFWALVERHCPDWKAAEKWLDEEGHRLAIGSLL